MLMVTLSNLLIIIITKFIIVFLKMKIQIKDFISQFLEKMIGPTYKPFHDYGTQIMYKCLIRKPDQALFPIYSKKDDNLVLF